MGMGQIDHPLISGGDGGVNSSIARWVHRSTGGRPSPTARWHRKPTERKFHELGSHNPSWQMTPQADGTEIARTGPELGSHNPS